MPKTGNFPKYWKTDKKGSQKLKKNREQTDNISIGSE